MITQNILILGDSYSTYDDCIPQGYASYYGPDRRYVSCADKTWWHLLATNLQANIVRNESWSGTTVCNCTKGWDGLDGTSKSFITRFDNYLRSAPHNYDTVLIFGGTNDNWLSVPCGNVKFDNWTKDDLRCFSPAFCYLLSRATSLPNVQVYVIINTDLKDEFSSAMVSACKHYNVPTVILHDINKEDGHPTELGMAQIAEQVKSAIV